MQSLKKSTSQKNWSTENMRLLQHTPIIFGICCLSGNPLFPHPPCQPPPPPPPPGPLKREIHFTIRLSQVWRETVYQLFIILTSLVHKALMSQERHLVSYLGILKSVFTGCMSKRGGSPSPSSIAVIPKDQTSQRAS